MEHGIGQPNERLDIVARCRFGHQVNHLELSQDGKGEGRSGFFICARKQPRIQKLVWRIPPILVAGAYSDVEDMDTIRVEDMHGQIDAASASLSLVSECKHKVPFPRFRSLPVLTSAVTPYAVKRQESMPDVAAVYAHWLRSETVVAAQEFRWRVRFVALGRVAFSPRSVTS